MLVDHATREARTAGAQGEGPRPLVPREHRGTRLADPNGPNWHFTVAMLMLAASPWFLSTSHLVLLIRADCVLSPQAAVGAKLEADERMSQFDEESRESGASSSLDNLSALAAFAVQALRSDHEMSHFRLVV